MLGSSPWTLVVAAAALAAPILAATAADAQFRRGVKPYYSESYETPGPERGYEGWVGPDYYCSYKRYPNRECSTDARGRERCRVTSWRLEQTCQ
jgi:hypothetical protein